MTELTMKPKRELTRKLKRLGNTDNDVLITAQVQEILRDIKAMVKGMVSERDIARTEVDELRHTLRTIKGYIEHAQNTRSINLAEIIGNIHVALNPEKSK